MCTTGNGALITFADIPPNNGNGVVSVGRIIRIGDWNESVDDIEDNDLSISDGDWMKYCPGGMIQHSEVPIDIVSNFDNLPPLGIIQLITIVYPVPAGLTNGAFRVGRGWLKQRSQGALENNVRAEGSYSIRFEGGAAGIAHGIAT